MTINLSKNYTLGKVINELKMLTRKLGASGKILQPDYIAMINRNTLDISGMLADAQDPYYQQKQIVNTAQSILTPTTRLAEGGYTDATRRITDVAHGLTSADIGKAIIMLLGNDFESAPSGDKFAFSFLESVYSADVFVITHAIGASYSELYWGIVPLSTQTSIDISTYNVDTIIKLMDSVNGEIGLAGNSAIEYIAGLDESANSVFYNQVGHSLEIKKGASVTGLGTLTLDYYRIPNLASALTDKIDLSDKYIPLLINKCKMDIHDFLSIAPPVDLVNAVTSKIAGLRESGATREQSKATNRE